MGLSPWTIAKPLNTAPIDDWSTAVTALCRSTLGDQPVIVPSSESNRNRLCPVTPFLVTLNDGPAKLVKTVPVGAPWLPSAAGMATVSGLLAKVVVE